MCRQATNSRLNPCVIERSSTHEKFEWVLENGKLVREFPVDGDNGDDDEDDDDRVVTRKLPKSGMRCLACMNDLVKWQNRITGGPELRVHNKVTQKGRPAQGSGLCAFHFKAKREY